MKKCGKCGFSKEDSSFNKNKRALDGLSGYCKECNKAYYAEYKKNNPEKIKKLSKKWYNENRERVRHNAYVRDFKITLEDYNRQLEKQNHKCAICGATDDQKELAVDHCHSTGKVRGLLCFRCNGSIGKFEDDISILQSAIEYLINPPYEDKDE